MRSTLSLIEAFRGRRSTFIPYSKQPDFCFMPASIGVSLLLMAVGARFCRYFAYNCKETQSSTNRSTPTAATRSLLEAYSKLIRSLLAAQSKLTRSVLEAYSKPNRSLREAYSKPTRIQLEANSKLTRSLLEANSNLTRSLLDANSKLTRCQFEAYSKLT